MFISKDTKFELHAKGVTIKRLVTSEGYFRNKITGDNCGKSVTLKKYYFDESGRELQEPLIEENCYEVVKNDD